MVLLCNWADGGVIERHFCSVGRCSCDKTVISCNTLPAHVYELEWYDQMPLNMTLDLVHCSNWLTIKTYRALLGKLFNVVLLPSVFMVVDPTSTKPYTTQIAPGTEGVVTRNHLTSSYGLTQTTHVNTYTSRPIDNTRDTNIGTTSTTITRNSNTIVSAPIVTTTSATTWMRTRTPKPVLTTMMLATGTPHHKQQYIQNSDQGSIREKDNDIADTGMSTEVADATMFDDHKMDITTERIFVAETTVSTTENGTFYEHVERSRWTVLDVILLGCFIGLLVLICSGLIAFSVHYHWRRRAGIWVRNYDVETVEGALNYRGRRNPANNELEMFDIDSDQYFEDNLL